MAERESDLLRGIRQRGAVRYAGDPAGRTYRAFLCEKGAAGQRDRAHAFPDGVSDVQISAWRE